MAIYVKTADGFGEKLGSGTGWHVDEEGYLHIRGTSGNVATFHRGHWVSAMRLSQ